MFLEHFDGSTLICDEVDCCCYIMSCGAPIGEVHTDVAATSFLKRKLDCSQIDKLLVCSFCYGKNCKSKFLLLSPSTIFEAARNEFVVSEVFKAGA